jgi:hypothetical protein
MKLLLKSLMIVALTWSSADAQSSDLEPLTTDALRIEVQLQPGHSGGVLEWRVK